MKENVYFAYSKPTATTFDSWGNITNVEDLQSQYQELYAVKKNTILNQAFNIGDRILYTVYNHCRVPWSGVEYYKEMIIDTIADSNNVNCCFYIADDTSANSGKTILKFPNVPTATEKEYNANQQLVSEFTPSNVLNSKPYIYDTTQQVLSTQIFNTNIPIFPNFETAQQYQAGYIGVEFAINYNKGFNTETGEWEEMPLEQSGKVAFYMQDDIYDLRLVSDVEIDVVRYSTDGNTWTDTQAIQFNEFISPYPHTIDGVEYQSILWNTNIPIFGSLEDAENYFQGTENIENALNYNDLSSEEEKDVALGEVVDGEMGLNRTSLRGAFCSRYAVNNSVLTEITNKFFIDDETILQNIKDGLELYGQQPMDSIIDLTYYPFDVSLFSTSSPQSYIYFGRYQLALDNNVNKIINLNTIIDCGQVSFPTTYGDYRDYEPYTELYAYLPYCGLTKLNISDYIGKSLGVKYGVDVTTGACECFILANGKIIDRLTGQMGVRQFITSMDSAQYTSNVTNSILGGSGNMISSTVGAIGHTVSGNYGGAIANTGGALFGGLKGLQGFKNAVENVPYRTRGNATSMLNQYDIQYPFFMFVYTDIQKCDDLTLVGKPSNRRGKINSFSGFLKCNEVKVRSNATADEIKMIENILKNGVYL